MSVYFARVGEYMKIGYSHDPISRATTITRSGKRPSDVAFKAQVDLIGWVPGDVWRERAFHIQHINDRVEGEWFRLDREYAERLIWDDPCGVDMRRMSAMAVFACLRYPDATRDELEAAGVQIEATVDAEFLRGWLGGAA